VFLGGLVGGRGFGESWEGRVVGFCWGGGGFLGGRGGGYSGGFWVFVLGGFPPPAATPSLPGQKKKIFPLTAPVRGGKRQGQIQRERNAAGNQPVIRRRTEKKKPDLLLSSGPAQVLGDITDEGFRVGVPRENSETAMAFCAGEETKWVKNKVIVEGENGWLTSQGIGGRSGCRRGK